jgi:O-antigen/teichoic acid export membrane protein
MRSTSPSATDGSDSGGAGQVQRVAGGALIALVGGVLSIGLTTAYQLVIARQLGSSGFGLFVLALAVSSFLAESCDLGLDYGVLRFGGIAHSAREAARFRAVIFRALGGTLVAGIVAGALLAAGAGLVGRMFGKPELASILVPLAFAVPCTGAAEVGRAALRATGRALPSVASDSMLAPLLRLVTGGWAVAVTPSPHAAAIAYAATEAVVLMVTLWLVWRALPRGGGAARVPGLFRFSLPMSLNRVILYTNNQTEIVVLGVLAPAATLGIFGVAKRLSMIIGALLTSVTVLFNPMVADLHHRGRIGELDRLFKTSTRWLFTLGWPVCLAEVLFAPAIVRLFGKGFASGAAALVILALGQLVNVGTGTVSNLLAMAGKTTLTLVNSIVFLALSLALDLVLIPRYGLIGAAAANAAAIAAVNLLRLWQTRRVLGIGPYDRRFLRPLLAGLVAGAAAALTPLDEIGGFLALGIRCALLGLAYLVLLWVLGIEQEDREVARAVLSRLRRGRVRRDDRDRHGRVARPAIPGKEAAS